jgi:hypothetical protein
MTEEETLKFHTAGLIGNVIAAVGFKKLGWSDKPMQFTINPAPFTPENWRKGAYITTQQPFTGSLAAPMIRQLEQSMHVHLTVLSQIGKKNVDT